MTTERPSFREQLAALLPAFFGTAILGTILCVIAGWIHTTISAQGYLSSMGSGAPTELPSFMPKVAWSYGLAYLVARLSATPRRTTARETSSGRIFLGNAAVGALFGAIGSLGIFVIQRTADSSATAGLIALATGTFAGALLGVFAFLERGLARTGPIVQGDLDRFVLGIAVGGLGLLAVVSQVIRLESGFLAGGTVMPGSAEEADAAKGFYDLLPILIPLCASVASPFALALVARGRGWRLISQATFVTLGGVVAMPLVGFAFSFAAMNFVTPGMGGNAGIQSLLSTGGDFATAISPLLEAPLIPLAFEAADRVLAYLAARAAGGETPSEAAAPAPEAASAPPVQTS